MKLRFGIDAAAHAQIRGRLEALREAPPVGRRLADVYLDTPDGALAAKGVALRFRRRSGLGGGAARPARRQEVWPKGTEAPSIKKLGIPRLQQRLDATFTIRTVRWTWQLRGGWAAVSLDRSEVSTGAVQDSFDDLRIVCKRKRRDAAMRLAVELGAMHLSSTRAPDRGLALLER